MVNTLKDNTYLILAAIVLSAVWLNNDSKSVNVWFSFSENIIYHVQLTLKLYITKLLVANTADPDQTAL